MSSVLYGVPISPFVRKVILALELKGVDYTLEAANPFALPVDYEKIHPLKKIPAFKDDRVSLPDSSVICEYLDNRYPDTPLFPGNIEDRARCRWLEEYADSKMIQVFGLPLLMELVIKPSFLGKEADAELAEKNWNANAPEVFDYLEEQVTGSDFIFSSITMADLSIYSHLVSVYLADKEVDASRWPKLAAYYAFMDEQPVCVTHMGRLNKLLGR